MEILKLANLWCFFLFLSLSHTLTSLPLSFLSSLSPPSPPFLFSPSISLPSFLYISLAAYSCFFSLPSLSLPSFLYLGFSHSLLLSLPSSLSLPVPLSLSFPLSFSRKNILKKKRRKKNSVENQTSFRHLKAFFHHRQTGKRLFQLTIL